MDCREVFGVVRFSTFSTLSANSGHSRTDKLSAKTLSGPSTDSISAGSLSVS
jgi:hypothetical protein